MKIQSAAAALGRLGGLAARNQSTAATASWSAAARKLRARNGRKRKASGRKSKVIKDFRQVKKSEKKD